MKPSLLFVCPAFLCMDLHVRAQDIPTDVVGDTGWLVHGPDTLVLVRAADGHVWLQQNMGAARVAITHNDAMAFGDRYQWGRWEDGHASPASLTALASTLSPNNPLGLGAGSDRFYIGPNPSDWWGAGSAFDTWQGTIASAQNGIDPCAALGGEWRLPEQAEWVNVIAMEGITNFTTGFASNLKLATAGARDGGTGTVINAGNAGQYWSSTPSSFYAKDLTVGDSWVTPDDDALRSYGMSVRCLNASLHVDVREHRGDRGPRIFPNPSTGTFAVEHNGMTINSIVVYSADMRAIIAVIPGGTTTSLSLDRFPSGVYWIRLGSLDGILWRMVFVER